MSVMSLHDRVLRRNTNLSVDTGKKVVPERKPCMWCYRDKKCVCVCACVSKPIILSILPECKVQEMTLERLTRP